MPRLPSSTRNGRNSFNRKMQIPGMSVCPGPSVCQSVSPPYHLSPYIEMLDWSSDWGGRSYQWKCITNCLLCLVLLLKLTISFIQLLASQSQPFSANSLPPPAGRASCLVVKLNESDSDKRCMRWRKAGWPRRRGTMIGVIASSDLLICSQWRTGGTRVGLCRRHSYLFYNFLLSLVRHLIL